MNGTSLAIIQADELDTIQRTGRMLAASGYFDAKGDSAQSIAMMATKIMAGREMGFGPFASVNGVHIISGKPSVGANLMAAAVKGNGRYDYRVREMTDKVCKIEFFQRNGDKLESLGVSEFNATDATKAGTKNMDKFPRNMLFARAMSNGVRWYCPDVFNGNAVYVPEELGAEVDGDGNVIDTTYSVSKPPTQDAPATQQQAQDARDGNNASTNPFEDSNAPDDVEAELLDSWKTPADAHAWAVAIGACENIFEAQNSFKNLVAAHFGGKCTKSNLASVHLAYMRKQEAKLEELFQEEQTEQEKVSA